MIGVWLSNASCPGPLFLNEKVGSIRTPFGISIPIVSPIPLMPFHAVSLYPTLGFENRFNCASHSISNSTLFDPTLLPHYLFPLCLTTLSSMKRRLHSILLPNRSWSISMRFSWSSLSHLMPYSLILTYQLLAQCPIFLWGSAPIGHSDSSNFLLLHTVFPVAACNCNGS